MPLHRVWEYRDIGRLFITVGGRESDNRGVEVGLVEVILRVSLEVILHHLLRQELREREDRVALVREQPTAHAQAGPTSNTVFPIRVREFDIPPSQVTLVPAQNGCL